MTPRRHRRPSRPEHATAAPVPLRREHVRADGRPKDRFSSEEEANRAAFGYRLEHGVELGAYHCTVCGGWHLGNADR